MSYTFTVQISFTFCSHKLHQLIKLLWIKEQLKKKSDFHLSLGFIFNPGSKIIFNIMKQEYEFWHIHPRSSLQAKVRKKVFHSILSTVVIHVNIHLFIYLWQEFILTCPGRWRLKSKPTTNSVWCSILSKGWRLSFMFQVRIVKSYEHEASNDLLWGEHWPKHK